MEERVPLEKPSLSHTSKEPEGQAWAQIGTVSSFIQEESKLPERDEDTNSEVQLHVDEDAEPFTTDYSDENDLQRQDDVSVKKESENYERKDDDGRVDRDNEKDVLDDEDDKGSSTLTNSGNPRYIRARVFVGHLNTEKCSRKDVEKIFSRFGKVEGCSLQHGYGFVQFMDEESAKRAIRELHGEHYFGMKLVVDKPVALKKLLGEDPRAPAPWPLDPRNPRDRERIDEMHRRELYDRYARIEELERHYYDRYQPPPPPRRDPYYDRYMDRHSYFPPPPPDRYMDRYRYEGFERERFYDRPPPPQFYDRPRDDPYDRREHFERRNPMRDPLDRYGPPLPPPRRL